MNNALKAAVVTWADLNPPASRDRGVGCAVRPIVRCRLVAAARDTKVGWRLTTLSHRSLRRGRPPGAARVTVAFTRSTVNCE